MTTPSSEAAPRRGSASRRRAAARGRSTVAEDDTEQVRALRAKYPTQLAMLSELFPTWSDEDLLFVLQESGGEVELAVGRISEGHAEQFSSVKSKKTQKKEAAAAHAAAAPALPTATTATVATTMPEGERRARGADRATRGRGAAAPAVRAGRGGFRGVARGAAGATAPSQVNASVPVTTTAAAFSLRSAPAARPVASSSDEKPASSARTGMSWAQVARPPPAKPAAPPTTETFAKAPQDVPASASASVPAPAPTSASTTAPSPAVAAPVASVPAPAAPVATTAVSAAVSPPAVSAAPAAEASSVTPSRAARPVRPRPEAAVVLPGGASLDHLGVQFGSLNFMAGDSGEPASAPAAAEPIAPRQGAVAESHKPETQPVPGEFDAFHAHALAGTGAYGLSGARPGPTDEASGALAYGASSPAAGMPGYSSLYALDSHQRTAPAYPYTASTGASGLRAADERSAGAVASGPLTPGVGAGPTQPPAAQAAPEPQAGMQQPFPNVMPYYYPYYMPNQFQHFSPAAGFGQYPLYGGQPQPPPSKPDAAAGLQAYAHDTAASTPYSTHTPPQAYQPTPGGAVPAYESQGFAQRLSTGTGAAGASDFKLAGTDANGALPSLGFLGAGPPPNVPATQGRASASGAPNVSSPLDYRALEAGKPAAGRPAGATGTGTGAIPPPSGVPTPQGQQAPMAQQHPAYYQQYAGFSQANAYDGYSYRQPYWG